MPLGVPWSKRMRIWCSRRTHGKRRHVEAPRREFKHRLNLLARHMKLLDDFLDVRPGFKIFEHGGDGHAGIFENPCAAAPIGHALHGGALTNQELPYCFPPSIVALYHTTLKPPRTKPLAVSPREKHGGAGERPGMLQACRRP